MEDKYQQLDSIVNSWWDSLPKEMQNELNKFYDNKHGYIVEKKED